MLHGVDCWLFQLWMVDCGFVSGWVSTWLMTPGIAYLWTSHKCIGSVILAGPKSGESQRGLGPSVVW